MNARTKTVVAAGAMGMSALLLAGCAGGTSDAAEPTGTPTPTATQTPAAATKTGMALIEQIVQEVAADNVDPGDGRPAGEVTKDGTSLRIVIPASDNLSKGFIRGGFYRDAKKILTAVQESGAKVTKVAIQGTFPMQDKRGNDLGDIPVLTVAYDDVNDLNLPNLPAIEDAADRIYVHPALR